MTLYALAGSYAAAGFRAFDSRLRELDDRPDERHALEDEILDAAITDAGIAFVNTLPETVGRGVHAVAA